MGFGDLSFLKRMAVGRFRRWRHPAVVRLLEFVSAIEQALDSRPRRCCPGQFDPKQQAQGRVDGLIDASSPNVT